MECLATAVFSFVYAAAHKVHFESSGPKCGEKPTMATATVCPVIVYNLQLRLSPAQLPQRTKVGRAGQYRLHPVPPKSPAA